MKNYKKVDVILSILLVLTHLFIGTPIKYNIDILNIIINLIAIIYVGWSYIKKKEKITINKIDICVLIISVSTFIPLLSNKYLRLRDTIYYIIKYISMLNIYLIIKKYIKTDKNNIKIITNIIIIMSIVLIIIGMDLLTTNTLEKVYEIFKIVTVYNESTYSMSSLFRYSNAFATFINFSIFLTIGAYLNQEEKSKFKRIYGMCIFFQMFGILASYSRLSLIFLIIFTIIFAILAKEKRKEIIKIVLISGLSATIYFMLFARLRINGNFIIMWLFLIFISVFNYILLYKVKIKNKTKTIILCIISVLITIIVNIILSQKLVLFNNSNAKQSFRKQNIQVQPNTQYKIKVDIKSISKEKNNFSFCVKELDSNEKGIAEENIYFDNHEGIKEINITTKPTTKTITIIFKCFKLSEDTRFEVKNVYVNEEKIHVTYGLIPVEFINRLQKLNIQSTSVQARIAYIKEGFKIAQKNIIFGYGGNAWRFVTKDLAIEDSIAEHSYPLQILIQFGAVGFISYISLIAILTKQMYKYLKNIKDNYIITGIILAVYLIILHSMVDFEMSFFNIFLTFYIYIAILSIITEQTSTQINYKWMYLYEIITIIFLYINIGGLIAYNIKTHTIKNNEQKLKAINMQIALAPFDYSYKIDKANCLATLKNTNVYKKESDEYKKACEEIIKQQKFIIEIEKKTEENEYRTLIYNKIDLITEESQEQVLSEITQILNNKNINDKSLIINGIKSRLTKKINNEKTKLYIESLEDIV